MITPRQCKTVVLCLVIFCLAALPSSAVRIPVSPDGDGDVRDFGTYTRSNPVIEARHYWELAADGSLMNAESERAVVEIPISSLQGMYLAGATITFNYYVLSQYGPMGLQAGYYQADGLVSTGDYLRVGYNSVAVPHYWHSGMQWNCVDVSSYIQAQLASGYSWASFLFNAPGQTTVWIAAAEDPLGRGSYLEITPVPEPSSLLALVAGISGLGGMIIRRRK